MQKYTPIIDAGHGGLINGIYTTGEKKQYTFEQDGLTIYEGVVNRGIARKLIKMLDEHCVEYHYITPGNEDIPLSKRVADANAIYKKNKGVYLLDIHSNSASKSIRGKGTKANGFEVYTSKGYTGSDPIAEVFASCYEGNFPDYKLRTDKSDGDKDKEADFYVLRKTKCRAVLVENLFFDNRSEAEFLLSEEGQYAIATCLFEGIVMTEDLL